LVLDLKFTLVAEAPSGEYDRKSLHGM